MLSFLLLLAIVTADPSAAPDGNEASPFEESIVPLVPVTPRDEFQQARIASAALYAESRLLQRRQEFPAALRRLQRAWRHQPQAVELLPEIVLLASDLQRTDETVRYALIAAGQTHIDPLVLRRLALRLSSQQRLPEALRLYELLLEQTKVPTEVDSMELGDALLWFELGRICFLLRDYGRASEYFSRIQPLIESPDKISQNPTLQKMLVGQPDQTYLLLAESFLQAGQFARAEGMFRRVHEALPDEGALHCRLARIAAQQGDDDRALDYMDRCLNETPHSLDGDDLRLLADVLSRRFGEQAETELLKRLESAAEADEPSPAVIRFLAAWQTDKQRWDQAQRWFLRLIDAEPDETVLAGLCEAYWKQQQVEPLLDTLGQAAAAGVTLRDLGDLGERLVTDETLVGTLLAETRKRLDADQQATALTGVSLAAADLAIGARRYDEAESFFDIALQWKEDDLRASTLLNWGLDLLMDRQYARAIKVFRRGLEDKRLADREAQSRYFLVRALAWAGEIDQAMAEAETAAAAFPDLPRLASLPALILSHAKRYEQAEAKYQAVLERFDGMHDDAALRSEMREVRLSLSHVCTRLDKNAEAEEWLEQVLDEFPDDAGALNDLGYLWAEQGKNLQWALRMIQKAVDTDPENAAYLDSLGWVYFRLGQDAEAVRWLEKAAGGDEPDGVILDHLGDAYWKANQPEKAVEIWRRAVETFEKSADSSKRDETLEKIEAYENRKQ
ncbi:MAG: tetratricopeptide repeat protein [Pirellulaceae bacterium]|nr:tetratricopeptide repeat protein [Pirellulaceae bacterium]